MCMCVCVCVRARMRACARERACVRMCVCMCMYENQGTDVRDETPFVISTPFLLQVTVGLGLPENWHMSCGSEPTGRACWGEARRRPCKTVLKSVNFGGAE